MPIQKTSAIKIQYLKKADKFLAKNSNVITKKR